jgi:MFS family permease
MYYITYIFNMAGLTGNINLISSSIQYIINVGMTFPTLVYVDKWGRRPLLLFGCVIMALWLFLAGGLMGAYGEPVAQIDGNSNLTWMVGGPASKAVIASIYMFVATFAPTWYFPTKS